MKIVQVTHYFSTHGGGVENVAREIATRIAQGGNAQVAWFASDCDKAPGDCAGVTFEPVPAWNFMERLGLPWPLWGTSAYSRLRKAIYAADIVHLHDFIYSGSLMAFWIARNYGKPIVVTQHIGDIPYQSKLLTWLLKAINRTIGPFVLGRARQVVFYSKVVYAQFSQSVRFKNDPVDIANGIDSSRFSPVTENDRAKIRSELANDPSRTVCLFVGRFVEKKGMPLLKRLIASFPDVEWWVLGWGAARREMNPETWDFPNLRLFHDRSGNVLDKLCRGADLLVLPSKGEGFPLVVQQAMACGTPALISRATADAVPEARPFLLTADLDGSVRDFDRVVLVLRNAISSGTLANLRPMVATYAKRTWSWDEAAGRYEALYRSLLGCDRVKRAMT